MLLTLPWFLSILGGRVTIDPTTWLPDYKLKLLPTTHMCSTSEVQTSGVSVKQPVRSAAKIMLCTAMIYMILQLPALYLRFEPIRDQAYSEHPYASFCTVLCFASFCIYLYIQYISSENSSIQQLRRDQSIRAAIASRKVTLLGVVSAELRAAMADDGMQGKDATSSGMHNAAPLSSVL